MSSKTLPGKKKKLLIQRENIKGENTTKNGDSGCSREADACLSGLLVVCVELQAIIGGLPVGPKEFGTTRQRET